MLNFENLILELKGTNSTNEKKEILGRYNSEYIRKCLYYILNPFYKYNVTKAGFLNYFEENSKGITTDKNTYGENVFELLDALRTRELTGHKALNAISTFYNEAGKEQRLILFSALDKDMDCGVWATLVNKSIKGRETLIPEFNVTRAYKIQDVLKNNDSLDYKNNSYVASRKLDGIRCIAIFENNNLQFFSREWNEFLSLSKLRDVLLPKIQKLWFSSIVLDWELCIMDENGKEDFKQITKEFRKKDHTIESPYYIIFDMIETEDFYNGKGATTFSSRWERVKSMEPELTTRYSGLLAYSDVISSEEEILKQSAHAKEMGWEWLILRNINAPYEGKRTKNLLKIKKFSDAEFEVVWVEMWTQGVLEWGVMVDKEIMARLNILYKGNIVWVWTGFSLEERLHYFSHPEDIIWKRITVEYMEESVDKNGEPSLRHPSFKGIRDYE